MPDGPMTTTRHITAPLDQLYLHRFNPRQTATDDQVEAKAASIATSVGLMQELLAYQDPDREGFGIVGGGLRLRGLQKLAEEGWSRTHDQQKITEIPLHVTDDPIVARAWALGENVSREELSPAQEIRAYAAQAAQGLSAEMIARGFGKPARHVARRLALAALDDEVIDALEAGQISLEVARALTIARSPEAQVETLQAAIENGWNEWYVRRELEEGSIDSDDWRVRCIGLPAYIEAGGAMTEDLFQDHALLHDEKLLKKLFGDRLARIADEVKAEGWAEVRVVTDNHWIHHLTSGLDKHRPPSVELPEGDAQELDALEDAIRGRAATTEELARLKELRDRREGAYPDDVIEAGTAFVYAERNGQVEISRGWMKRGKGGGTTTAAGTDDAPAKPPIPDNLRQELITLRTAALMGGLVDKTDLVLDMLAWQLDGHLPPYSAPFNISTSLHPLPDASDSVTVDKRLTELKDWHQRNEDDCLMFDAFRELGKKHRNQVLARHLPRALRSVGDASAMAEMEREFSVGLRKVWTPTAETFFKRCRAEFLDNLWAELLELEDDDERRAQFRNQSRAQKAKDLEDLFTNAEVQETHGLSRAQIQKIDAWVPGDV
ncbi:Nucleoid occlusion protein [Roseovarius sp. THAF27]|uniref:ParB/RepB/Spo0J family partition protein n=1 Tax=Roseovarius sp. THAF27 TaxID=2587850 RepID=UPI0012689C6E|nr:ParB/RepB/Spo0J family partition protein [Roseovarius sp. THAF27]QFT81194.1 Nucleoid occlusion protein [Roseovarius sp. THAF27]